MQTKQLQLFSHKQLRFFGGSLLKGHAKKARPISTKESLHLVLKSKYALGQNSMLQKKNALQINFLVRKQAQKFGVKIYEFVNVGNHLHLVIRVGHRQLYSHFIRSITGLIARHVMGAERGSAGQALAKSDDMSSKGSASRSKKFWEARPFTRLIAWGKDYLYVKKYMDKNRDQVTPQRHFKAWGFDIVAPEKILYLSTS